MTTFSCVSNSYHQYRKLLCYLFFMSINYVHSNIIRYSNDCYHNQNFVIKFAHVITPFSYVPKGFIYVRAHICTGTICEQTNYVNDKLRNVLTSPTIDVSFYESRSGYQNEQDLINAIFLENVANAHVRTPISDNGNANMH